MPAKLKQISVHDRPIRASEQRPGCDAGDTNTVCEIVLTFVVAKGSTHFEKRVRTRIPVWSKPITVSSHLMWLANSIANKEKNGDFG